MRRFFQSKEMQEKDQLLSAAMDEVMRLKHQLNNALNYGQKLLDRACSAEYNLDAATDRIDELTRERDRWRDGHVHNGGDVMDRLFKKYQLLYQHVAKERSDALEELREVAAELEDAKVELAEAREDLERMKKRCESEEKKRCEWQRNLGMTEAELAEKIRDNMRLEQRLAEAAHHLVILGYSAMKAMEIVKDGNPTIGVTHECVLRDCPICEKKEIE